MRFALLAVITFALAHTSCMDPLHDYNKCVKVETARCQLRESCVSGFDYGTCVAFYKEFCRTRKINGPGSDMLTDEMVQACVDAILAVPCESLIPGFDETELLPECEFLQKEPEDTDPDAGDGDAGGDTDTDTDTDTEVDSNS
ncbi:MAG: hypothetical protein JRF63_14215, partial [Deltaproteobacteria bacterium]|nr:hypothetical protein [Deltaproteobacteria bacterium]